MRKIAVLLSGSGRTLDNFHECIQTGTMKAEIQVVVSNVHDALGLEKAEKYGYPAFHATDNSAINKILAEYFSARSTATFKALLDGSEPSSGTKIFANI